LEVY